MSTYIGTIFDALKDLDNSSFEIRSLARSFGATGNGMMYDRLSAIADDVECSKKTIMEAVANRSCEDVQAGNRQIGGLLSLLVTRTEKGVGQ